MICLKRALRKHIFEIRACQNSTFLALTLFATLTGALERGQEVPGDKIVCVYDHFANKEL